MNKAKRPKVTKAQAQAAFKRIKSGESQLGQESAQLGQKGNDALRKALIELVGNKAKYHEFIKSTQKQKISVTGPPTVSDTDVPRIGSMKQKDGWRTTSISVHLKTIHLFHAPDGTQYIQAASNGKANLICTAPLARDLPALRLRLFEGSSTERKVEAGKGKIIKKKTVAKKKTVKLAKKVMKKVVKKVVKKKTVVRKRSSRKK